MSNLIWQPRLPWANELILFRFRSNTEDCLLWLTICIIDRMCQIDIRNQKKNTIVVLTFSYGKLIRNYSFVAGADMFYKLSRNEKNAFIIQNQIFVKNLCRCLTGFEIRSASEIFPSECEAIPVLYSTNDSYKEKYPVCSPRRRQTHKRTSQYLPRYTYCLYYIMHVLYYKFTISYLIHITS